MAETTHTLKFRADSRAVKVAGQEIKKAFDPRSSREFRRELGSLQRRLKDITSAQVGLVKELQRTEEGTKRFKELEGQLEAVADQAKTVKTAIGGITSAFKDFNAERRRGFVAGVAQGVGVAQYIPSEAGMGRRIAGGMVGRGIRGAAGAAMAPLRQPGIGGLTTALGAIPIVGQMAAGAVQALSGMYQEAVAYHQARVENLQYIQGGAIAAAARGRRIGITAATSAALATAGRGIRKGRVTAAARGVAREELEAELWRPTVVGGRVVTGGPAAEESPYAKRAREEFAKLTKQQQISMTMARGGQVAREVAEFAGVQLPGITVGGQRVRVMSPREVLDRYRKLRNKVLDDISEDIVKDIAKEKRREARREAAARFPKAFWRESVPLPGAGFGARFGFRAAETQAQLSAFMQARGGEFTRLGRRQFEGALAARRVYGIQAQTAGAFARMAEPGGGGVGNIGLATTLQMAFELGLRGAQIPEYLQSLVQLGQTAEKQGVKINERDFGRSAALMKSVGLRGPQISRVTTGLIGAGMELSQRGVSSPVDMIMMRAAGYDPSQGIEGYATAMNKLAGGMDVEMMSNLMQMATTGARGGVGGAGRQTTILMLRRLFGRMKMPIGPGIATTLLDAQQQGKLGREHLEMLTRNMKEGERRDAHPELLRGARVGVGMVAGLTKTEATLEARRIGLGIKMAGTMVTLNTASLNAATAVSNFRSELNTVAKWMADLTRGLSDITKGGTEGIWSNIKNLIFSKGG